MLSNHKQYPEDQIAVNSYSADLLPKIQPVPEDLAELHGYISAIFESVDEALEKFDTITASNQSTAENTTFTHEPLYKAKELLVQLVKDILNDDTKKILESKESKDHPLAHFVTFALIKICQVAANVVNKGAETSEAYRWILTGCKLIEKLQQQQKPSLTHDEMKSCVDVRYISKYSAAPIPEFFPYVVTATNNNSNNTNTSDNNKTPPSYSVIATSLALELLIHAAQIWTLWTETENVRKIAEVAEKLCGNVPETGGVLYKGDADKAQDGAEFFTHKIMSIKEKLALRQKSDVPSSAADDIEQKHAQEEIERYSNIKKSASIQEADAILRLETRRAARNNKEPCFVFIPPKWARPYLNMKRYLGFTAITPSRWCQGFLEDPQWCEDRLLDMFTCIVQANKGNANNHVSSYYSTLALQYRLPMCLHSEVVMNRSTVDEWIGLCLSLCEYYVEERDLSHAEHLLSVSEALMEHFGAQRGALTTLSTYKGYSTPNGVMLNLLRVKVYAMMMKLYYDALLEEQERLNTPIDASSKSASPAVASSSPPSSPSLLSASPIQDDTKAKVKLFQNPLCPPEDFNGQTITETNKPASWTTKLVDTTKRIDLIAKCADKNLHENVAAPRQEREIDFKRLKEFALQLLVRFQDGEKIIPNLLSALDVNEDCERFILSRRAVSEFYSIIFIITRKIIYAEKRLQMLTEIRSAALHENVFRNVLRQAEFEHGTQSLSIGDMLPTDGDSRAQYHKQAVDSLTKFCHSFEREMKLAKDAQVPIPLEGSDFVAYGLGQMRRIEALLKVATNAEKKNQSSGADDEVVKKLRGEAADNAKTLIEFATTYSKDGGERLAEMKVLANEFVKVLNGGKGVIDEQHLANQVRKVEKKVIKKVIVKHKDPSAAASSSSTTKKK